MKRIILVLVVLVSTAGILWFISDVNKRSVAAYCKTLAEERRRFVGLAGTSYSSLLLEATTDNPREYAASFAKLEKVAPSDVRSNTKTLKELYEKMNDSNRVAWDPLVRQPIDRDLNEWAKHHCQ